MSVDKARTFLKVGKRIEITLTSEYENADVKVVKPYVDDLDKSLQLMKECHLADLETGYTKYNRYYIKVIIYDDRKITIDEFLYIRLKIAKIMSAVENTMESYKREEKIMDRTELKVVDYLDRLNVEGKYSLVVKGNTVDESGNVIEKESEIDMPNLTTEQIGVIGGLLDAIFDNLKLTNVTAAKIVKQED